MGATELLQECNWDMRVAVNAMLDAIHRRDEVCLYVPSSSCILVCVRAHVRWRALSLLSASARHLPHAVRAHAYAPVCASADEHTHVAGIGTLYFSSLLLP